MIFRFPINFKSEVEETSLLSGRKFFYHVVLGIAYKGGDKEGYYQSWNYLSYSLICHCVKSFQK